MGKAHEYFYSTGPIKAYEDIFNYFDSDKDGKLTPTQLWRMVGPPLGIARRIRVYDIEESIGVIEMCGIDNRMLSLPEFVDAIDEKDPIFHMVMHLAIRFQTYKQQLDCDDLGSVKEVDALNVMDVFSDGPCSHMVGQALKAMKRKNPDPNEGEAGIIRFEHLVQGFHALCEAENAKLNEEEIKKMRSQIKEQ